MRYDAQIEQLLQTTRGDIRRAKHIGYWTGRWTDDDVDRIVAKLQGKPYPPPLPLLPPTSRTGVRRPVITPRQADVLRLLCRGLSNCHIARELLLSEDTVKSHVKAILAALGAGDRTQAVYMVLTCEVDPSIEDHSGAPAAATAS
jgi:DNA-binding NarL/FixJ family response regulator